jgi:hypothetical protein
MQCGICKAEISKKEAHFIEEGRFSFLPQIPADLLHHVYCDACFSEKVATELSNYDEMVEQAKNVIVYEKNQGKETRLIKRQVPPVRVSECTDKEELILRLAFLALRAGFNAIIDVDIKSEKVKIDGYTTTKWHGSAVPANVNPERVVQDKALWHNPN